MARFVGTRGKDHLVGTPHNDNLFGLRGNDVLKGLGGNDHLNGGKGHDALFGGKGHDVFVFHNGDGGVNMDTGKYDDVVHDYTDGVDKFDVGSFSRTYISSGPIGAGTVVDYGTGNSVFVPHYTPDQWSPDDFI